MNLKLFLAGLTLTVASGALAQTAILSTSSAGYLSRGILSITLDAETNETSCSFETPPNKTATLILAIMITPLEFIT